MKFEKIYARDIIAALLIIGCFWLKLKGIDGTVSLIMVAIIGYYFSKRVFEENGRVKGA